MSFSVSVSLQTLKALLPARFPSIPSPTGKPFQTGFSVLLEYSFLVSLTLEMHPTSESEAVFSNVVLSHSRMPVVIAKFP